MMKNAFIFTLTLIFATLPAFCAKAGNINEPSDFNPGFILSDSEMRDYTSMDLEDIQAFLDSRLGILKYRKFEDLDGVKKSASKIIFRAANQYKINPKYVLVTLQKEQSLLDDPNPSQKQLDWAAGYGVCDSCSTTDSQIQKFKGFATQVDYAAGANDFYLRNSSQFRFQPGKTFEIDGRTVKIFNQATANLYIYTPHIHGNYNFWKLWNSYFTQKYPDGSLLQLEGAMGVWLIENGKKRPFHSRGALYSRYDPKNILIIKNKSELNQYPTGKPIKYAQYSLLRSSDNSVYLLVDDKLRHIANEEVFRTIGFNHEEIIDIPVDEVKLYEQGEPITINTAYPAGALLQNNESGAVYFVQNGIKHPVVNRYILDINFSNYHLSPVSPDELAKYERGENIKIKDGTLIKSYDSPAVYVISHGQRLKIGNEQVFNNLGYKWENIIVVDPSILVNIPRGEELMLSYVETE